MPKEHLREIFRFCQTEVPFWPACYAWLLHQHSDITAAIPNSSTPSSWVDLQSFVDLTNQLASSTSQIANVHLLLDLSSPKLTQWLHVDGRSAGESLSQGKGSLNLRHACLYTDASTLGIGFVLLQSPRQHPHHGRQWCSVNPTRVWHDLEHELDSPSIG